MEEIASVYARSLFEVATEADRIDQVREDLGQFTDALDEHNELQVFFFSPYFSTQEKKEGLDKAISGTEEIFHNFLELLIEKHRMPAVFRIRRAYDKLWEEENQLLPVEVTSAVELDESILERIGDQIGEQTGRKVELSSRVDENVLGGLVIRVGNSVLDASIRHRLEQLRKSVAKAA